MSDEKKLSNDEIRGAILARIFSAAAQPTEADRAKALEMTLKAMREDPYSNPQQLQSETQMQRENVRPAGAEPVKTFGWAEERPLPIHSAKGSREEALIDAMVEKFVGGPNKPVK